jgi:hypothetical protein
MVNDMTPLDWACVGFALTAWLFLLVASSMEPWPTEKLSGRIVVCSMIAAALPLVVMLACSGRVLTGR